VVCWVVTLRSLGWIERRHLQQAKTLPAGLLYQ
jgi:hypothetical protein